MLRFELDAKEKIARQKLLSIPLYDILDDDRHFAIFIDNETFFDDPYFAVREFVKCAISWLENRKEEFVYNTLNDYQNPLLSFISQGSEFKIFSVWQKFECKVTFCLETYNSF